jgi:AraC-like DNA-binding protein
MQLEKLKLDNRRQSRHLLVENRLSFAGPNSELSIYDTYDAAHRVGLGAGPLTYCGMVAGKKIMHDFSDQDGKAFLPHESYVMPPGEYVEIDFPEARESRPTTCLTIEIPRERIEQVSERMRDVISFDGVEHDWEYQSQIIHNHHTSDTQSLLDRLVALFTQNHPDKEILVDLGVTELIVKLLRQQGRDVLLSYCKNKPDTSGVTAVLHYLEHYYAVPLDIDDLAKKVCMSRSRFYVEFKKQLGCSPGEYQQQLRLKNAAEMIRTGHSISETCYDMGFNDLSHFSRRFTKFFGSTPRQFQAENFTKNSLDKS